MPKDEFDADDPMELMAVSMEGSFDEMADGIVDEYIMMNFDQEALWLLFSNPFYRSTYAILQQKGEAYVRGLIKRGLIRWAHKIETSDVTQLTDTCC